MIDRAYSTLSALIDKKQRRATKFIPDVCDLSYEERLNECRLTPLETRRLMGDQMVVFKILNGHENIDPNIYILYFLIKTGDHSKGHDLTLVKGQSSLDVRKYYFPPGDRK